MYLAAWIANRTPEASQKGWINGTKKGYHDLIHLFIPFIIFLIVISAILILQPDLTTLGIIALSLIVVYFAGKTPLWHTGSIIGGGLVALLLLVKFEPYRLDRFLVFMNPEADPLGKGFQLKQSLIALGSGGFFGKGLGMSSQKFGFLPQAMSDSVFAIIGEELGIVGCLVLLGMFILLFWQGIKIANGTTDRFSKLTAVGIIFWLTLQAFINIASTVGIFPLAGIPLPFFSYGGSHLLTELLAAGLLLNISKNS